MEQISEHSWQENAEIIKRLKHDYPTKVMGVSIMGANDEEWALLAREMPPQPKSKHLAIIS